VIRWLDVRSGRNVWVIERWPTERVWPSPHFALLVATDREIDAYPTAPQMLRLGLAAIEAWGPNCVGIERAFDRAVRDHEETVENVLLTTSHPGDPFATSLEWFLDIFQVADDYQPTCDAWVILALGTQELVERELIARRAHRL
jgi:hypothetical protein